MRAEAGRVLVPLVLVLLAAGSAGGARGPSSPHEREKAVKLVRELEADPSGKKARDARRWLALFLVEVPDFKIQYCPEILGGTLPQRQRIRNEILAQVTYSSLAYVIENPGKARSPFDVHRAGVLGALRAYEVLLAAEPEARSPLLDDLVAKRNAGELDAYLAETVKVCPGGRPLTAAFMAGAVADPTPTPGARRPPGPSPVSRS